MESRDINELMETTPSNPFEAEDPAENYPYIRSIVDTLNSVSIPGSFASGGSFQFSAPALKSLEWKATWASQYASFKQRLS